MIERGLLPTPFDARLRPLNLQQSWIGWAGYASPGHLEAVEAEYFAIRNQATLFDLSPMRKYRIAGDDAERVVNRLVTRDVRKLKPGRVAYALWCDEDGMVVEDGTVFRFAADEFRVCCQDPQYGWLCDAADGFDIEIVDVSEDIAAISLQGPTSFAVLEAAGLGEAAELRPFDHAAFDGITISRTGFTGDLGYELWANTDRALDLWDRLFETGKPVGLRAIGYDAVDIARLEAGFLAVGRDFISSHHALRSTRGRTPFELGYGTLVDFAKGHFNGRRALLRHRENGQRHALVGLDIEGMKPARAALVYHRRKAEIGHVTSAHWSPTCKRNLALAEVKAAFGSVGASDLQAEIYQDKEGKWERIMAAARIVERPFFRHPRRTATPPGRF